MQKVIRTTDLHTQFAHILLKELFDNGCAWIISSLMVNELDKMLPRLTSLARPSRLPLLRDSYEIATNQH